MQLKTAAIIIPSELFLKGEFNLSLDIERIAYSLKYMGYSLKKLSVVEESDRSVAYELTLFSKLYNIVIVLSHAKSECVSQALANITSQERVKFEELERYSSDYNIGELKWPISTKLLKSKSKTYPVIYLQRIFVLTIGFVEEQLSTVLNSYLRHYRKEDLYSKFFHISSNGYKKSFDEILNDNLMVTFEKHQQSEVEIDVLKLSSKNFEHIVNGELFLREKLGLSLLNSWVVNEMQEQIYHSSDKHIQIAIETIETCFDKYGFENIFLSFNGGKDCTVLLHLVKTVIANKYPDQNCTRVFCLYIRSKNAFKEQDEFIDQCRIFYNLEVISITSNIKDALGIILEKKPNLKACFMGTRRTDPYSVHLSVFQMTDPDWPQVVRCSPLLDWHFSDIWDYLLYYKVPYCKLYDYGYTSLGNASNTIRNPSLIFTDGDKETYLPAYKMLNEKKERSGRNVSKI